MGRSLKNSNIEQNFSKNLSDNLTLSTKDKTRDSIESEVKLMYEGESLKFYKELWGGDDIHIGIYEKSETNSETIKTASDRSKHVL